MARRARRGSTLFTIGYEKATARAVLDELKNAEVDLLADVRAVAASRRPGFSKRQLAAALDENEIDYLHLRALGTPADGRQAARSGRISELFRIYEAHLATPEAKQDLDALTDLVGAGRRVCLLCYEREAEQCHRRRIAELVSARLGVAVENLAPPLF